MLTDLTFTASPQEVGTRLDAALLARCPTSSRAFCRQAIEAGRRVGAKLIVLTHMHHDLDYRTLVADLPAGVVPAFDGMVIENGAVIDAAR